MFLSVYESSRILYKGLSEDDWSRISFTNIFATSMGSMEGSMGVNPLVRIEYGDEWNSAWG